MVTFDKVTLRDIETLAAWAKEQKRSKSWLTVVKRARGASHVALARIAKLINEKKGPWA